jgi:phosphoribosylformimino-5-aminoimidazole carboxamide ribotide isomerase
MIEIIPAIDLIDGRCVRLAEGDFDRKTEYADDPAAVARAFEAQGVRRLHVVDLDGARSGRVVNLAVLGAIAGSTGLTIDFGGGIKTDDDLRAVFDGGAAMASIGSIAVREPGKLRRWIEEFGPERFVLGADVRGRHLAIDGWRTDTDEEIIGFLRSWAADGIRRAFVTDIARDGMMSGPAVSLYAEIISAVPEIELIASGGVSSDADLSALESAGVGSAIVGKAIYEGRISSLKAPGPKETRGSDE